MYTIAYLLSLAINLYILVIIVQVAVSWMIAFEVINAENQQAKNLTNLLKKLTDPVYKPIRKFVPPIGGIDLTPLIVIVCLSLFEQLIIWRMFYGMFIY